jgi:hypothetical protein
LIFIGSDLHMMETFTGYDRPFYGRADEAVIRPLNPAEVASMIGLTGADALDAHLITGGLVDYEAAFVAAMIHDLGLTDEHRGTEEFGVIGADLAGRFLSERGWETDRIRLVEQAILRHANLKREDDPTYQVVQVGATIDVVGLGHEAIAGDDLTAVLRAYPRVDFIAKMRTLFLDEVHRHPQGVFAGLERDVRLSELFAANPIDRLG